MTTLRAKQEATTVQWYGVWAMREGYEGHWHSIHGGSRGKNEDLETTKTEAERICKALNEFAVEYSLGWSYEVRPYPSEPQ